MTHISRTGFTAGGLRAGGFARSTLGAVYDGRIHVSTKRGYVFVRFSVRILMLSVMLYVCYISIVRCKYTSGLRGLAI